MLFVDFDELILIAVSNFVEYSDVEDMLELFVLVKVVSYWVDKSNLELEIVEAAEVLFTLVEVANDDLVLFVDFDELILIAVSNFVKYFDVEDMTELFVLVKVLSYWVDNSNLELEIVDAPVVFFIFVLVIDSVDDGLVLFVVFDELIPIAVIKFVKYFDIEDMKELFVLVKVLSYWVDKSNLELENVEATVVFFILVMVSVITVVKADGVLSTFNEPSLIVEVARD